MTNTMNKCSANETAACCCVDVGTVMDNSDCTATWSEWFAQRSEAEAKLASLTKKRGRLNLTPARSTPASMSATTVCSLISVSPSPARPKP